GGDALGFAREFGRRCFGAERPASLAHRARPRPPLRRRVRLRRPLDGHLLSPVVPEPAAAARASRVLSRAGGGRAGGLPRVPPLPTARSRGAGPPRSAGSHGLPAQPRPPGCTRPPRRTERRRRPAAPSPPAAVPA